MRTRRSLTSPGNRKFKFEIDEGRSFRSALFFFAQAGSGSRRRRTGFFAPRGWHSKKKDTGMRTFPCHPIPVARPRNKKRATERIAPKRSVDSTPGRDFRHCNRRRSPPTSGFIEPVAGTRQFGEQAEEAATRRHGGTANANATADCLAGHQVSPSMKVGTTRARHAAGRFRSTVRAAVKPSKFACVFATVR